MIYNKKQIYKLLKFPHNKTPENKPNKIKTPPIVGVPIFLIIWSLGPSFLIGFKILFVEKNFIKGVPIKNTISIDVNIANPVLTVRYLKTLRKVYVSMNSKIIL